VKPESKPVTFTIDGREVTVPEGVMLVDGAKQGDVEIPVFCYEPKLGPPVGACRMCLVEVEGIPKLQTACSTPVKDGMVVYTESERVRDAQSAVVEFLLVNHPLDCPVCDKGGECPLQDITMGWGPGRARMTDPKRHFKKPIALSPLIAIDRERCILCYRCVRFSQEVAEDEQLQLLERGDRSFVGTFDGRPYVAPFHGNIIELCPVGALTSRPYRFRARPWEIEDGGSICTLCPSQCNVKFTVRDEKVLRVLARDNDEVDDGWLCDKGRFGYQMIGSADRIDRPMIREGGLLRGASWEEALSKAAEGLRGGGEHVAALVGGSASNEEGYLVQRLMRECLGSGHVDSRRQAMDRDLLARISAPELQAKVSDVDFADAVLVCEADPIHGAPILDLRIRKAVRRNGTRLYTACSRPTALDGGATETASYAPGDAADFLGGEAAGDWLRESGDVVIVWGERLGWGPRGAQALEALLALADALGLAGREGSGLLEVPEETNARGLREVGCLPNAGPGLSAPAAEGQPATAMPDFLNAERHSAALLWEANPVRDHPKGSAWDHALTHSFLVAVSLFENESTRHADVVLPAETHAEKDGTVTHPDGRLQRLRPATGHPGETRMGWQVLVELAARLGTNFDLHTGPMVLAALANEVPFYAGITHEEIGGLGVRWQDREAATRLPAVGGGRGTPPSLPSPGDSQSLSASAPGPAPDAVRGGTPTSHEGGNGLLLGTYRDLWASEVTERNPALEFLAVSQTLELSLADAQRLGLASGDEVRASVNGASVRARVAIRERLREGSAFLIEGTASDNANVLVEGAPQPLEVEKL
jgi:NADH-quinone oxidoreductase subunit G